MPASHETTSQNPWTVRRHHPFSEVIQQVSLSAGMKAKFGAVDGATMPALRFPYLPREFIPTQ
jgi:hypothetical protein